MDKIKQRPTVLGSNWYSEEKSSTRRGHSGGRKGVFQTECSWETSREARRKLGDSMWEKQARRGPCWDRNECGKFREQTGRDLRVQSRAGDSRTARAVAGEGSRVMPLERHEPHRMRGAANRLHTPPSRGAKSLPGPHLCCPRIKSSSVQSLSHVQLFATPWTAAHQASLSITNSIWMYSNGNPLQCSCLENPRDGGAWWASVYGVAQSQTRLKRLSSSSSMSTESVMPSNHLILCRPLLFPPSIFPSIRVFSNKSVFHIRWPKYWSFSFSISPSNEYSGLISFKMDW